MSLPDLLDCLPKHPAVIWVPFHLAHVKTMRIQAQNMQAISKCVPVEQMLQAQAFYGHAVTAMMHGTPAAVFGSVYIWKGVEELWMLCEERVRKIPILMTKAGRTMSDYRVIAGNLHRLQVTVRLEDERALKWAEVIGFEREAVMRRYGPDQMDYQLMART